MGRRTVAAGLIALGTVLGVMAILAVWTSRQVLETDQWVETSSQLLEDPAIQSAVGTYLVDELYANVDVAGEIRSALPDRAQVLAAPAAGALRRGAEDVVDRALDRPRVQQAWETANRRAHERFVQVVEGGGDVVSTEEGVVTLNLRTLLQDMAQRTGLGSRVADKLPAQAASIEILRSDQLDSVQSIANALKPLAVVLVLLTLACFGGAIAVSEGRRREALRASGWAFIVAGLFALVVRQLVGDAVVEELAQTASVEPAVAATWEISTSMLTGVAWAAIAYGALTVAGAWFAGPTRVATAGRAAISPELRDPRIAFGATAAVVLLVLLWGPTEGTQRPLPALILISLLFAGVAVLRRQTMREFPDAVRGKGEGARTIPQRLRHVVDTVRPARAATPATATPAAAGAPATPAAAAGSSPAPPAASEDLWLTRLERLDALHRDGVLSDEEFASAKGHVLSGT